MKVQIRHARKTDLPEYTKLLQKTYKNSYTNEEMGLTKECFSEEVFKSLNNQKYLASNLLVNDKQKCWLAFVGSKLVGSISIIEWSKDYELRGFYVGTKEQGKGIGKKLWKLALSFVNGKDITCDIYAHNIKTIEIYKEWGFDVDAERGEFYRHWPEWPEGVKARCIYMRYKVK